MLVVLALLSVLTGAVVLQLRAPSDDLAGREAALLAARLDRAASSALMEGRAFQFVREADRYRFLTETAEGWEPHPLPILGEAHELPRGLSLESAAGSGDFVLDAALLPRSGAALDLTLAGGPVPLSVRFDGIATRIGGQE